MGSKNTIKVSEILHLLKLKKVQLNNNKQVRDINNINLKKIKKQIQLPDIFKEVEKYFDEEINKL